MPNGINFTTIYFHKSIKPLRSKKKVIATSPSLPTTTQTLNYLQMTNLFPNVGRDVSYLPPGGPT